jgi:glycogen operon protein
LNQLLARAVKTWHGVKIGRPDWSSSSHSIALSAHMPEENVITYLIFNAYWEPLEFQLPHGDRGPWKRWIDTALDAPNDIVPWRDSPIVPGFKYVAGARSVVALHTEVDE